jgi:hypothetical protein
MADKTVCGCIGSQQYDITSKTKYKPDTSGAGVALSPEGSVYSFISHHVGSEK